MDQIPKHIAIVGGGLAGLAAAAALAPYTSVTLIESRFALGGRASSFEDQENAGELLDNCQHVLLGCCTNLLDLYRRLGVLKKIAFHKRVHFLDPHGRRHDLWSLGTAIPAPLHLGPAMALFSALTLAERTAVVRAMLAMLRLGVSGREKLETTPFGTWLDQHRQPASLIQKFYDPIIISALNEQTRLASAKYAIQVFQDSLLGNTRGYVVGLPACPLGELYANVPPNVTLRLNTRVDELLFDPQNPKSIRAIRLRGGEEIPADAIILATNHHAAQRWLADLPPDVLAADTRFAGLAKLESVPILGTHLWFDRPVMQIPSAALIGGPLQWLFRKDAEGRVLHGVISAARDWPAIPKEEALRQFEQQVRSLFPSARDAKLQRGIIVIEKRATFSPLPGTDALRPPQAPPPGGIANLFLAGDYTRTDWPATMEGAVRSGYLAADAILGKRASLVPDLKIQWPARLLGLAR